MINTELNNINDWLNINKLTLNTGKCKYMIFHTPQKNLNQLQLKIDNIIIDKVKEIIFLGLTLNEHINWKSHIDKIANKIQEVCEF